MSQLKGALHKRRPFPCNPIPAANCNRGHLNRRRFGAMLLPGGMGLAVLDVENVVRHYSYTGLGWLRRFQEKRSTLDPARYDRIFQRMWEYYLSCGIAAARASDAAVYQVLFHNDRAGDIPLERV